MAAQEKRMSLQLPGGSNHCESAYNEKKPMLAKPKAKFVFGKNQKKYGKNQKKEIETT